MIASRMMRFDATESREPFSRVTSIARSSVPVPGSASGKIALSVFTCSLASAVDKDVARALQADLGVLPRHALDGILQDEIVSRTAAYLERNSFQIEFAVQGFAAKHQQARHVTLLFLRDYLATASFSPAIPRRDSGETRSASASP